MKFISRYLTFLINLHDFYIWGSKFERSITVIIQLKVVFNSQYFINNF